jgi:hypothetical protein
MRVWGASASLAVFTIIASGILSSIAFAGLVAAAVIFAKTGSLEPTLLGVALAGLIVLLIFGRRYFHHPDPLTHFAERVLGWGNGLLHREPNSGRARLHELIADLTCVTPRKRDWAAGLGFASINWAADLVCLMAACRAVNMHSTSLALITAAYVTGMSTSGISLLPGGLGVVDGAIILVLTHGHVGAVTATAAVLLYRLVSYAFNVVLGWLLWTISWYATRRRALPESILEEIPDRPADLTVEWSLRR